MRTDGRTGRSQSSLIAIYRSHLANIASFFNYRLITCSPVQWRTQEFFFGGGGYGRNFFFRGGSTNLVEDRGQRERVSEGGSPLVRGSAQFANELNPYSE
jgi:hypothetical protein